MKISNEIEIIDNLPAAYFKTIDAIAIADLHLGYEGIAAEQGVLLPKTQFKEEMEMLKRILENKKSSKIILLGDIKHEFSETSYHEFKEVSDLLKFLKENFKQVIVIKGNHDNYIYYVTSKFGAELYDELIIDDYYFIHGHQDLALKQLKAKTIVIGHEHPVIALYDEVGGKETVKCFLYGKTKFGKNLLVLPAFSTLSHGTEINLVSKEELLSPILKTVDLDDFEAIGVDKEIGILKFGKIGELKSLI
jgi:putative SbcD/Mre11-related phosphoesterase